MQSQQSFLTYIRRNKFAWLAFASVAILVLALILGLNAQAAPATQSPPFTAGVLQVATGSIDGYVLAVVNGGDWGLSNWTVHVEPQGGGTELTTTTDGNGYYRFDDLAPGDYKVWIDLQPGWVLYPGTVNPVENVGVTADNVSGVLFKVEQGGTPTPGTPTPATRIDGYVYEETCEGVVPYQGALLEAWSSNTPDVVETLVQQTYSDAGGYFNLHILPDYLKDYLHLLLKVPSDMEVISTIAPEGVVVGPDHIRFDFPGFESFSGNQFILRKKDLMCETPTPTPTATITPTPTPYKIYLPIIRTRPPMCEVGYIYVNVWGKEYHIPLQDVPYVYTLRPLPWQHPTTFYLREYEGYVKWTQYDPTYKKQVGGYEFTYPGGHPGAEFTLYVRTDCGEVAIMSNIDDPTPTPPPPAATPQAGWVILAQQDFDEASMGNVERSGSPTWGLASCEARSDPFSIWPAARGRTAAQPCVENYPNNMEAWLVLGPFNLVNATRAEVTFDYWLDTEKGADWFGWYASEDDVTYSGIRESGNSNGWNSQTFDLSNWVGKDKVWVALVFESDDQVTDKGVFVDNVVVRKFVDGRPPRTRPLQVAAPDFDSSVQFATLIRR